MSIEVQSNNKRIAKNSLFLYIRMFITLLIGLYTSRVVLRELGVEDYGIYNVVGGVILMMSFVNNSMAVATQRFLTVELGRNNFQEYSRIFSMCLQIYAVLALLIILIGETIGVWFVNTQLVIPAERMEAANWIFQTSLVASCISLITIPYNASVISHERMNFFAYISIVEAFLKLGIAFLLTWSPIDKLITYGFLMLAVMSFNLFCYSVYCKRSFQECRYSLTKDKKLCTDILSYSGWNLFGAFSMVTKGQGLNLLLGMFFGPAVNAARGIAYQINSMVSQFFSSFYTAVQPQITKYYAQKDYVNMDKLVFRSSKFAYYLILLVSLPIIFQAPYIIRLWLGQLPELVVPFVRIIIFITAVDSLSYPLMTAVQATGNIKTYQVTIGLVILLNIPISYCFLKLGLPAVIVFYVSCVISTTAHFIRIWFTRKLLNFPVKRYLREVMVVILCVTLISTIVPYVIQHYFWDEQNFMCFIGMSIICVSSVLITIYAIGLRKEEKGIIRSYARKLATLSTLRRK